MDVNEKDFYTKLNKLKAFESDLKEVFKKHNIVLKNEVEMWHGGSEEIVQIFMDGEHWVSWNFDETLNNIEVI